MDFTEKLKRASAEVNKSRAGLRVGLKAKTISAYVTNQAIPRVDIALKIARALDVPLEWLADDSKGWPPPTRESLSPSDLTDEQVMREFGQRMRLAFKDWIGQLDAAERIDWKAVRRKTKPLDPSDTLPPELEKEMMVASGLYALYAAIGHQRGIAFSEIPGLPSNEEIDAAPERYRRIMQDADLKAVLEWRGLTWKQSAEIFQKFRTKKEK